MNIFVCRQEWRGGVVYSLYSSNDFIVLTISIRLKWVILMFGLFVKLSSTLQILTKGKHNISNFFFFEKMGHSRPLFLYFCLFNFNVQLVHKVCRFWDSNHGSLVSEASALPTEPPPLPISNFYLFDQVIHLCLIRTSRTWNYSIKWHWLIIDCCSFDQQCMEFRANIRNAHIEWFSWMWSFFCQSTNVGLYSGDSKRRWT